LARTATTSCFNGALQRVDGRASLSPLPQNARLGASVTVDMASTYAGQAEQVKREVTLRPDASVSFKDSWRAPKAAPVTASWQWLTTARARKEKGGVALEQDGRVLHLRVKNPYATIEVQDVATLLSERFDAPLPGYTRIVVSTPTKAGARGTLEVAAVLEPASAAVAAGQRR